MLTIDKSKAIQLILNAHPEFEKLWNDHNLYWNNNSPGFLSDLNIYTSLIHEFIIQKKHSELKKVAEIIEMLINEGNKEVHYATTIGLLEDITNMLSWEGKSRQKYFIQFLKPKSLAFCKELDNIWGTKTPGL